MRITNLRSETSDGRSRVAAELCFENSGRDPRTLYYEVPARLAASLSPEPGAFVSAAVPLAMVTGERRVSIEGGLSHRSRDGAELASRMLLNNAPWCEPVAVVADRLVAGEAPAPRRTAAFLSGGIDALTQLRLNRLHFPPDHPGYIRDCVVIFGLHSFEVDSRGPVPERIPPHERRLARLEQLGAAEGFEIIPLYTNVRSLFDTYALWRATGLGGCYSSCALTLGKRITDAWLASAGSCRTRLIGHTHPMLDRCFSTTRVQIHTGQPMMSRLDKTRIVADWPAGLGVLETCIAIEPPGVGQVNCGRCEKCIRTMLALLAIGRLEAAVTFGDNDVDPAWLSVVHVQNDEDVGYYAPLCAPLRDIGRDDLAGVLEAKLARFHAYRHWESDPGFRGLLRRLDRRAFNGRLLRLSTRLRATLGS